MARTKLSLTGIENILSRLDGAIEGALEVVAIEIRDEAKRLAPKDTTALTESIYISSQKTSDYAEAIQKAEEKFNQAKSNGKTPKGIPIAKDQKFLGLPEVRPEEKHVVFIVAGMSYAVDNEFGTVRIGASPFLIPATLSAKGLLTSGIRTAMSGLSVKASYQLYSTLK